MVLAMLAVLAPTADAAPEVCEDAPVLVHEQYSGLSTPRVELLTDERSYCAAWDAIYSIFDPAPACDTSRIDFTAQAAVLVAIGERPDGCYDARVACVHRRAGDLVGVGVLQTVPGPYCACTDALVQPVEIIAVDLPVSGTVFKRRVRELDCAYP